MSKIEKCACGGDAGCRICNGAGLVAVFNSDEIEGMRQAIRSTGFGAPGSNEIMVAVHKVAPSEVTEGTHAVVKALLREELATYVHETWSAWMNYLFAMCRPKKASNGDWLPVEIPAASVNRWMRMQMTAYADLSNDEKSSDRRQADVIMHIVDRFLER